MQKLRVHRMLPGMSRPGNPHDNATCKSFLKTIEREASVMGNFMSPKRFPNIGSALS